MRRAMHIIRYVVAIYMALYFALNASFIHNHNIGGHSISHAHPFTQEQHTEEEAGIIQLFNITPTVAAVPIEVPLCIILPAVETLQFYRAVCTQDHNLASSQRGPPAFSFSSSSR